MELTILWQLSTGQLILFQVGHSDAYIDGGRPKCRIEECSFGNFVTDAMASEMGVDIAFINSGAIKGSFDPARRNGELYISKLISTGKENIHEYNLVTASNKINRIRKKAWQDILSQKIWVALFLFQCLFFTEPREVGFYP